MNWKRGGKIALGVGLSCLLGAEAGWAAYAAVRWLRYPAGPVAPRGAPSPLDRFMPRAEVDEVVSIAVSAPPEAVMAAARALDFGRIPGVSAIFAGRALLMGLGPGAAVPSGPFMDQIGSLGWELLEEEPGRYAIFAAVTRPWEGNVVFRPLKAADFIAFDLPGFAKIAWTIRAEPHGQGGSVCLTETRVVTTDAAARRKFRRYWSVFSPGILLIRHLALRSIKSAAERRFPA